MLYFILAKKPFFNHDVGSELVYMMNEKEARKIISQVIKF
jgi:hypothetical protein